MKLGNYTKKKRAAIIQLISAYTNTSFMIISGLFFVPLYFQYFNISTYGAWLASGNILNLFSIIEGGISTVYFQKLAVEFERNDLLEFSKVVVSGFLIMTVVGILIFFSTLVLAPFLQLFISGVDLKHTYLEVAFILAGGAACLSMISGSLSLIWQSWHSNETPAIVGIIAAIGGLVSIFVALTIYNAGVASLGIGAFVRSAINTLALGVCTFITWRNRKFPFPALDLSYTKAMLAKSFPMFSANLLSILSNNSKELFVALLLNPASVAILAITGRIFSLVSTLINPICGSVFSAFSSFSLNQTKFSNSVIELFKFFNIFSGLFFGIGLAINGYFVAAWLGADKYGGLLLSCILCITTWVSSKLALNIMVLNAKAIFNKTAWILLIDICIRFIFYLLIYSLQVPFELFYFPLIELGAKVVSMLLLERTIAHTVLFGAHSELYNYINVVIVNVLFGTMLSFYLPLFTIFSLSGKWETFIFALLIVSIVFVLYVIASKNNRKLLMQVSGIVIK